MRDTMRCWVEVSVAAVQANLRRLQAHVGPRVRFLAIVKADAYGHDAVLLASGLADQVDGLGVANVEEALRLRAAGIRGPIHVLSPLLPGEEETLLEAGAVAFIGSWQEACRLEQAAGARRQRLEVHLKVDTGMGRVGCALEQAVDLLQRFQGLPHLQITGLATHFACAEEPGQDVTWEQLARFRTVADHPAAAGLCRHVANSAALLRFPEAHLDMVRPGLALYGVSPLPDGESPVELEPALAWKTRVLQVRDFPAGSTLSYGATFRLERPGRIALLPVGYADGYPWRAANQAWVLIRGQRAPVVGRVCMDLTLVEVTSLPGVHPGEEVVLVGRQGRDRIGVRELAAWAGTSPYEILTRIGPRVARRLTAAAS